MKSFLANTDVTIVFTIVHDGELHAPDVGSVKYDARFHDGTLFAIDTQITTTSTQTDVLVQIPAVRNSLTKNYEFRYVTLKYTIGNKPFRIDTSYRLHSWVNLAIAPKDVRIFIGVTESELPNDDIDLIGAYLLVDDEVEGVLPIALTGSGTASHFANRAVLLRAVLEAIPSLQLRLLQTEQTDNQVGKRFASIDIEQLKHLTQQAYSQALLEITGAGIENITMLVVNTPTDVITNA